MKTIWNKTLVVLSTAALASSGACVVFDGGDADGADGGEEFDPCLPPATLDGAFTITGDCDVTVDGLEIVAGGRLTVEAGATVRFPSGRGLYVSPDGVLVVDGTAEAPVTLRAAAADWFGVDIESSSVDNALSHVVIDGAGAGAFLFGEAAGLQLRETGRAAVEDVVIANSAGAGLALKAGAAGSFARVAVNGAAGASAVVAADAAHLLNDTVDLAGDPANGTPRVVVQGTGLSADRTWASLDVPWEITEQLELAHTLTVSAGARLVFRTAAGFVVTDEGGLAMAGTAEARITLGPVTAGDRFLGVSVASNRQANRLAFVDIVGGGSGTILFQPAAGAVYVPDGGRLAIEDSTITGADGFGLVLGDDVDLTIVRSTIADHEDGAASVGANALGDLGADNTWSDDVVVRGGTVVDDATWADLGVAVHIEDTVAIEADVVLADGGELAFGSDVALDVTADGTFGVADDGAEAQAVLRGEEPTAGFWSGVFYSSQSVNNAIRGALLKDAGGAPLLFGSPCGVFIYGGASATVENTTFENIEGDGIRIATDGDLTDSGNTFTNVSGLDVFDESV